MAKRMIREEAWSYKEFVLGNAEVAEDGHMACFDTSTGDVVAGKASTTLIPFGWFAESMTGDGTKKINIRLFSEVDLAWWDNADAPNAVEAADIGSSCYVLDSHTVTADATGHSIAGRVLAVHATKGVLVQAGLAVTGPSGSSGASVLGGGVADRTALAAVTAANRYDGKLTLVRSDGSLWRFVAASAVGEDEAQELVIEPDAGTGRWVRADKAFVMKLPVGFGTTDAAALLTVPEGFVLRLTGHPFWDVTTAFTGGTASAIGVSTDVTGYDTKGDLLGGASGDVAAGLTAGVRAGTLGGELDDNVGFQALALVEDDVIRFDRITSAFTAGAGFVCVPVAVAIPA